jgi:hypothetical protein
MGKTFSTGLLTNGLWQDASNNIGIGGSPSGSFKFEVTGTGRFTSDLSITGGSYFLQRASGSAILPVLRYWNGTGNPMNGGALGDILTIGTQGTNDFTIATDNTRRLTITSGGYLNIANNTAQLLPISAGNFQILGGMYYNGSSLIAANGDGCRILFSGGNFQFNTFTGATIGNSVSDTERMRITNTGNVSIGSTTDSGFRLYAKGTNGLYVEGGTSNSNSALLINNNAGDTQYLRVRGDGYLFSTPTYNNTWPGSSANMYIASDGSFGRITASSLRFKENINEWNGKGLETILALKPKTFKYKKDYCDRADIELLGLIAEEVAEISPYLAEFENPDRTGQVENVRYDIIVVPLIAAIQELSAKVSALENKS